MEISKFTAPETNQIILFSIIAAGIDKKSN
jgi:hypothetical protein